MQLAQTINSLKALARQLDDNYEDLLKKYKQYGKKLDSLEPASLEYTLLLSAFLTVENLLEQNCKTSGLSFQRYKLKEDRPFSITNSLVSLLEIEG